MSQRLAAQLGLLASAIVFAISLGILVAQNVDSPSTGATQNTTATDTTHHAPAMPLSAAAVDQH